MTRLLSFIDSLNAWVGKSFGWLILVLTLGISYEVFMRKLVNAPTTWAFDVSYITYGALFLMAGPYTLSRNGHVRADVLYRLWPQRIQAALDLFLYTVFYVPAVLALIYAGWTFAAMSVRFQEVSIFSPANIPVFPLKALIPVAGALLLLQGFSEVVRCIVCLRRGQWPPRLQDVEELESAILREKEYQAKHGQKAAAGQKEA